MEYFFIKSKDHESVKLVDIDGIINQKSLFQKNPKKLLKSHVLHIYNTPTVERKAIEVHDNLNTYNDIRPNRLEITPTTSPTNI